MEAGDSSSLRLKNGPGVFTVSPPCDVPRPGSSDAVTNNKITRPNIDVHVPSKAAAVSTYDQQPVAASSRGMSREQSEQPQRHQEKDTHHRKKYKCREDGQQHRHQHRYKDEEEQQQRNRCKKNQQQQHVYRDEDEEEEQQQIYRFKDEEKQQQVYRGDHNEEEENKQLHKCEELHQYKRNHRCYHHHQHHRNTECHHEDKGKQRQHQQHQHQHQRESLSGRSDEEDDGRRTEKEGNTRRWKRLKERRSCRLTHSKHHSSSRRRSDVAAWRSRSSRSLTTEECGVYCGQQHTRWSPRRRRRRHLLRAEEKERKHRHLSVEEGEEERERRRGSGDSESSIRYQQHLMDVKGRHHTRKRSWQQPPDTLLLERNDHSQRKKEEQQRRRGTPQQHRGYSQQHLAGSEQQSGSWHSDQDSAAARKDVASPGHLQRQRDSHFQQHWSSGAPPLPIIRTDSASAADNTIIPLPTEEEEETAKKEEMPWPHDCFHVDLRSCSAGSAVCVRGLPTDISVTALQTAFSRCGYVLSVRLEGDRIRTATISYLEPTAAAKAVRLFHGSVLHAACTSHSICNSSSEQRRDNRRSCSRSHSPAPSYGGVDTCHQRCGSSSSSSSNFSRGNNVSSHPSSINSNQRSSSINNSSSSTDSSHSSYRYTERIPSGYCCMQTARTFFLDRRSSTTRRWTCNCITGIPSSLDEDKSSNLIVTCRNSESRSIPGCRHCGGINSQTSLTFNRKRNLFGSDFSCESRGRCSMLKVAVLEKDQQPESLADAGEDHGNEKENSTALYLRPTVHHTPQLQNHRNLHLLTLPLSSRGATLSPTSFLIAKQRSGRAQGFFLQPCDLSCDLVGSSSAADLLLPDNLTFWPDAVNWSRHTKVSPTPRVVQSTQVVESPPLARSHNDFTERRRDMIIRYSRYNRERNKRSLQSVGGRRITGNLNDGRKSASREAAELFLSILRVEDLLLTIKRWKSYCLSREGKHTPLTETER